MPGTDLREIWISELPGLPFVFLCFMTAGRTAAAIFSLTKSYRQFPCPEGHSHPHVFRQSARMSLMAEPASSSCRDLADMNEMQIAIAVAKSSQRCRALFFHQCGFMATKAESVFRFLERSVKLLRILIGQESEISGTVRFVACRAFFALHGPVLPRIRYQELSHRFQFTLTDLDGFIVASQTSIRLLGKEQMIVLGQVRIMTIHTGGRLSDRRMFYFHRFLLLESFFVTFDAKHGNGCLQLVALLR